MPIKDYPGYYVSNKGNVMSKKRTETKLLAQRQSRLGYQLVVLCKNSRMASIQVNRLVLAAFEGYPADPWLCVAYHKDGNLQNCRLDNLEWMICETTDEYDPEISHRRGVLKPEPTKDRMSLAKYNQSEETIRKQMESRARTMGIRRYCR